MNNIFQMLKQFGSPQAFLQNAMNNSQFMQNPLAKNAMEMYQRGDIDGVKAMAENLCKERGTTIDEVKNGILSTFGRT